MSFQIEQSKKLPATPVNWRTLTITKANSAESLEHSWINRQLKKARKQENDQINQSEGQTTWRRQPQAPTPLSNR